MRFSGKLHTWNEEKGFGFIRPEGGGQDIFVHVSALPAPRPGPDEVLTFELGQNAEGRKKAVQVRRQAVEAAGLAADRSQARRGSAQEQRRDGSRGGRGGAWIGKVVVLAIVAGMGWYGWQQASTRGLLRGSAPPLAAEEEAASGSVPTGNFRCDGRTHCPQMTSCQEARFFLANCPGVKMDGNNDGIPCEQQWCTGG